MWEISDWKTPATHHEDVVFEGDEAMTCDFGPDAFGDVAANTLANQFASDGFIT